MNTSVSFAKFSFCLVLLLSCCPGFGAQSEEGSITVGQLIEKLESGLPLGDDVCFHNFELEYRGYMGITKSFLLHEVIRRRNMEQFEEVLAKGADVNQATSEGVTPLGLTCYLRAVDDKKVLKTMAKRLIAAGAEYEKTLASIGALPTYHDKAIKILNKGFKKN